jgi:dihydroflavonol-4-reductase
MIYVTGATGHIGNNIVRALVAGGYQTTALVRRRSPAVETAGAPMIVGDIFQADWLSSQLQKDDIFIHSAGVIDLSKQDRQASEIVNVHGTQTILNVCAARGVYLLLVSSVDAIEKPKNGGIIRTPDIQTLNGVKSHYSMTKAIAAKEVATALANQVLQGAIVYPAAVIGPHDYKPSRVGKELLAIQRRKIVFHLNGGYCFIDVRDVANAVVRIISTKQTGHFILGAHNVSIKSFYEAIERVTKRQLIVLPLPVAIAKVGCLFFKSYSSVMIDAVLENHDYDLEPMKKGLEIEPIPFETTLKDTLEWLQSHTK